MYAAVHGEERVVFQQVEGVPLELDGCSVYGQAQVGDFKGKLPALRDNLCLKVERSVFLEPFPSQGGPGHCKMCFHGGKRLPGGYVPAVAAGVQRDPGVCPDLPQYGEGVAEILCHLGHWFVLYGEVGLKVGAVALEGGLAAPCDSDCGDGSLQPVDFKDLGVEIGDQAAVQVERDVHPSCRLECKGCTGGKADVVAVLVVL